jgi:hypothetical protein
MALIVPRFHRADLKAWREAHRENCNHKAAVANP